MDEAQRGELAAASESIEVIVWMASRMSLMRR